MAGRSAPLVALGFGVTVAVLAIGCGGESQKPTDDREAATTRIGGTLNVAIGREPGRLDPLTATTFEGQTVVRQIVEPLVERVRAPEGNSQQERGLALKLRSARGGKVWRVWLRQGLRFQDKTDFDANAVVANFRRWRTTSDGRSLLPGLRSAKARGRNVVRITFKQPVRDLSRRLRSGRLGVVSPAAMRPSSGARATLKRIQGAGTGPFVFDAEVRGTEIVLRRNSRWWGTTLELGPSLDGVAFKYFRSEREKLDALLHGNMDVALHLSLGSRRLARSDPNIHVMSARGGHWVGARKSVRGLRISGKTPSSLSSVWLTQTGT